MTSFHSPDDVQQGRWNAIYAAEHYVYGEDAGPVARRAVRYHRPRPANATALDAGCGEGQDLAFLVECGYHATGIDFAQTGAAKAQRLLEQRGLHADVRLGDLRTCPLAQYDLVLAVNSLQFLAEDAPACLNRLMAAVAAGGVLGLSLFAREDEPREDETPRDSTVRDGVFLVSLPDLLARFTPTPQAQWQMLEASELWQWNEQTDQPQAFVTLIARRLPL